MARKRKTTKRKSTGKKKSVRKKSSSKTASVKTASAKTRVKLKEVVKSKGLAIRRVQLGQAMQSLALSRTMMSATRTEVVRMPVREHYSTTEAAAKTRAVATRASAATRLAVSAITSSAPPLNNPLTTSGRATTERVTDKTVLPYAAVGRIDVTAHPIDASGNFVPSGSPISWMGSGFVVGERTIYSAAHVLETPSRDPATGIVYKITSALFRPQNPSTLRSWAARNIIIHDNYFGAGLSTNLVFDMAAMVTDPDDVAIAPVTGKLGWKTSGVSLPTTGDGIGYPSNPPTSFGFNGNEMWRSLGEVRTASFVNFREKDNDMTRGCSGGPWVIDEGGTDGFRVIGLNSHVNDISDFNPMISPIFDDDFLEVIRGVRELEEEVNAGVDPGSPDFKPLL